MGRIRTIKPEFPQSESIGRLSRDARLFFILLWTICDDEGRTRAASRMLASLLYPYDDDAPRLIDGWIAEAEREGCIALYVVEGTHYIQVCKWLNHQKIDRPSPSRIPRLDESSRILANPRVSLAADLGSRILDLGSRILDHGPISEPEQKKKKGRARLRASLTPLPEPFEISERVRAWAEGHGYSQLDRYLDHFADQARARAYVYADWDSALMNAIRKDWAGVRTSQQAQTPKPAIGKTAQAIHTLEAMKNVHRKPDIGSDTAISLLGVGGTTGLGVDLGDGDDMDRTSVVDQS